MKNETLAMIEEWPGHHPRRWGTRFFDTIGQCTAGYYEARGLEITTPRVVLRVGTMKMLGGARQPSLFYIGNRKTPMWTFRIWNLGVSVKPND